MVRKKIKWISLLLALVLLLQGGMVPAGAEEYTDATLSSEDPEALKRSQETWGQGMETQSQEEPVEEAAPAAQTQPEEAQEPAEAAAPETQPTEAEETQPTEVEETQPPQEDANILWKADVPLYFQTDYPETRYANGTIASNGCSITSVAMVATYLTGHEYLPDELARYFGGQGLNNVERLEIASTALQLPYHKAENWHEALKALKEGKIIIVLVNSNSSFTEGQHFLVLTGMTKDGKIFVNDSFEPNYDYWKLKDGFENGFIQDFIVAGYSGAWIYDPEAMPEEPFIYTPPEREQVECRYPQIQLTYEQLNLLASMVWVEARGESMEGQRAVAEVVFNRMVSEGFPDSIEGVIYADNQFRSTKFLEDAEPTQAQYDAIDWALYGPYVLPEDVVYFAQYPVNDNVWGEIGGHVFCYDFD